MSRIHEALKKAEQERGPVSPFQDIAAAPPEPISTVPERPTSMLSATTAPVLEPEPPPALRSGYLRFEDLRANCAHPEWRPDLSRNVFFNPDLAPNAAEQFRTLRSRLYQLRDHATLRTLLITSSEAGEGKTFVASNLAQAIVRQSDRRVLMIDADLRCARLHTVMGAPSRPGLTDYLRGETDETSIIQQELESNLCLIPGGTEVTNPSELLSNGRLKRLLDRVAPAFDWIILDSPPCLPVADASILANFCDGVLLVVRATATSTEIAQRACQELKDKNLLGVVLNAVKKEDGSYGAYYAEGYGTLYGQKELKDSQN
jgi:capsular exopolysaccharide synthesis family protein